MVAAYVSTLAPSLLCPSQDDATDYQNADTFSVRIVYKIGSILPSHIFWRLTLITMSTTLCAIYKGSRTYRKRLHMKHRSIRAQLAGQQYETGLSKSLLSKLS
jgi:hypothetical protein